MRIIALIIKIGLVICSLFEHFNPGHERQPQLLKSADDSTWFNYCSLKGAKKVLVGRYQRATGPVLTSDKEEKHVILPFSFPEVSTGTVALATLYIGVLTK